MSKGPERGWQPVAPAPLSPPSQNQPALPVERTSAVETSSTPVRPRPHRHRAYGSEFDTPAPHAAPLGDPQPSRFIAPATETAASGHRIPIKAVTVGIALVVLAGIFAGVAYVRWFRPAVEDPGVLVKPTQSQSEQTVTSTPQEIVERYFAALAAGDIELALSMGPHGSGNESLLGPDVYAKTSELGPIRDLEVLTKATSATEIDVKYFVGDEPVEATMQLTRTDSGDFQLARTTLEVRLQLSGSGALPLLVNGTKIEPGQTYELVPGRYDMSTGLPFIEYAAADDFTIRSLWRTETSTHTATAELTDAGRTAFIDAAQASLTACLAKSETNPSGCPNRVTVARTPVAGSVEWHLGNKPFERAVPTLAPEDQTYARMALNLNTWASMTFAGGAESKGTPNTRTVQAKAALTGTTADSIWVIWD